MASAHRDPGPGAGRDSRASSSPSARRGAQPVQATVPAPRVHPAGLVHRVGHDRPDRAGRDPVRRGHRPADRRPDQADRRAVVHRLGVSVLAVVQQAGPIATALLIAGAGGSAIAPTSAPQDPRRARRDEGARHRPDPAARRTPGAGLHAGLGLPQRPGQRGRRRRRLLLQRRPAGRHAGRLPGQLHRAGPAPRPVDRPDQGADLRADRRHRRLLQGPERRRRPEGRR